MSRLIELLDSLIVQVESMPATATPSRLYALDLCLVHLRLARTILNSIR